MQFAGRELSVLFTQVTNPNMKNKTPIMMIDLDVLVAGLLLLAVVLRTLQLFA